MMMAVNLFGGRRRTVRDGGGRCGRHGQGDGGNSWCCWRSYVV